VPNLGWFIHVFQENSIIVGSISLGLGLVCDHGAAKIPNAKSDKCSLGAETTDVGSVDSSWVTKVPWTSVTRKPKKSALFQNPTRDSSFGFPFYLQLLKNEKQM
jgi:hypothetical protein